MQIWHVKETEKSFPYRAGQLSDGGLSFATEFQIYSEGLPRWSCETDQYPETQVDQRRSNHLLLACHDERANPLLLCLRIRSDMIVVD